MTWNPWRDLRARRDLTLAFADLPGERGRFYANCRTILLDVRLGQAARRSTLAYELVRAERGDTPGPTDWHERHEMRASAETAARRLITLHRLIEALLWSQDEEELAETLWVDVDTVRARLRWLTDAEKRYIERRLAAREEAA